MMTDREEIAAQLEALARRLRGPALPAVDPVQPPDGPIPALAWDTRLTARGVAVVRAGTAHRLIEARYMEGDAAQGRHHLLVDVRDRNGVRKVGTQIACAWPDGSAAVSIEAKPGEPYGAAFPLFAAGNGYALVFAGWRIAGMGLGTIAEPYMGHHVSYGFVFQEV
jgi:hypothetical protein